MYHPRGRFCRHGTCSYVHKQTRGKIDYENSLNWYALEGEKKRDFHARWWVKRKYTLPPNETCLCVRGPQHLFAFLEIISFQQWDSTMEVWSATFFHSEEVSACLPPRYCSTCSFSQAPSIPLFPVCLSLPPSPSFLLHLTGFASFLSHGFCLLFLSASHLTLHHSTHLPLL